MVLGPPQQNCWTSAVLWMVLGPKGPMLSKLRTLAVLWMDLDTADLSSFMDGFGPSATDFIKTADLGSSMDFFLKWWRKLKVVILGGWIAIGLISFWFKQFFHKRSKRIQKNKDNLKYDPKIKRYFSILLNIFFNPNSLKWRSLLAHGRGRKKN